MIRILIVDDHAVVRQGLKKILVDQPDMAVLGEASNSEELMEMIDDKEWDIVIMDISLPGKSGLDVLRDIRQRYPKLPVLFLSMLPEDQFAIRAIKAGASGYLTKGSLPEELVKAIRKVAGGKKYISADLAEKLTGMIGTEVEHLPHERLSEREFQVMCKIAAGKSLTAIAEELYLSVKTIATYRTRLLTKMKMKTNAELTRYAIEHKLIE